MRLNKFISESGWCSRREADELISQQRVTLNGVIAVTGAKWLEGMTVLVDGHVVKQKAMVKNKRKHVYIALNKPVGITCTTDEAVDGNIVSFVDHRERIFPIGRLDKNSEGLILLTSNGDIVNELPAGSKTITLNGNKYYVSPDDVYYEETAGPNNTIRYKVVGK